MKISLLIIPPSIYNFFSLGLNGAPFSPDFALVKWTDTSNSALSSVKFMGFTAGSRGQSLKFGANCVLLKTQYTVLGQSPYVQVSPQQIQALQYQQYQLASGQASSQYQLTPQYQLEQWGAAPSKHPSDWVQHSYTGGGIRRYFSRPLTY